MKKIATMLLLATSLLAAPGTGQAESINLAGAWSGGGSIMFGSGARERASCRANYTRRSNGGYVVRAVCATASGKAAQTAALHKVGDNRYAGNFYNSEYGISGTISVIVRGNTQSVRLSSSSGRATLSFTR
jgi:hypothetical protein